jgi:methionyl-tRNA formyltransferase
MKKVGILGSRELSCNILKFINKQDNVEIIGVVAPPFKGWWNDNLKETALSLDIKIFNSIDELIDLSPDLVFSINYWKTISKDHINKVKEGIINIHHSYLLKYRGRYSTSWAIYNARKNNNWVHGTTLHYITEKLDEGPIIASYKCDIDENDTAESLFFKVEALALQMFKDFYLKIINGPVPQTIKPDPNYLFYDKDSNSNLELKYGAPIEEVYDFVRAWSFKDRNKPYFRFKDKKLTISIEDEK